MRFLTVLCASLLAVPAAGQALRPDGEPQDSVTIVDQVNAAGGVEAMVQDTIVGVPMDDSGKWHVSLFAGRDSESAALKRDFQSDPNLRAIAAWGHFNVLESTRESQATKFHAFNVSRLCVDGGGIVTPGALRTPCVFVYPPKDAEQWKIPTVQEPEGQWTQVFHQAGYDGNPTKLATDIVDAIQRFVAVHNPEQAPAEWVAGRVFPLFRRHYCQPYTYPNQDQEQCPPDGPCPLPAPVPNPVPPPFQNPLVLPNLPDILPPPKPDDEGEDAPGTFPDYPQITVIYDPLGLNEDRDKELLAALIERAKETVPEAKSAKCRLVPVNAPEAEVFGYTPNDTPAVVITSGGEVVSSLNRVMLGFLKQQLRDTLVPAPAPPQEANHALDLVLAVKADMLALSRQVADSVSLADRVRTDFRDKVKALYRQMGIWLVVLVLAIAGAVFAAYRRIVYKLNNGLPLLVERLAGATSFQGDDKVAAAVRKVLADNLPGFTPREPTAAPATPPA